MLVYFNENELLHIVRKQICFPIKNYPAAIKIALDKLVPVVQCGQPIVYEGFTESVLLSPGLDVMRNHEVKALLTSGPGLYIHKSCAEAATTPPPFMDRRIGASWSHGFLPPL